MRRTKTPTPLPEKKLVKGEREYRCCDCDVKFSMLWENPNKKPYCPKCGDNVKVLLNLKRKSTRSRSMPHWTEDQKKTLMQLYKTTDLKYKDIGQQMNRSEKSVYHMVRRLRLEAKQSK